MRFKQRSMSRWWCMSFVMIFLFWGCAGTPFFTSHEVRTQSEAGTVNVSVSLVAPWEDYVATLQPRFDLSAEKALEKVIPKTAVMEEKLLDALSLKAKVGLPQASGTTGSVPADTAIPEPQERKASDLPGLPDKEKTISREPMMEYSAAAALYQEIQILNSYIKHAALKYDYQPYVVRLQVGLLPYAKNQPYDVYTTFSFFPSCYKEGIRKEHQKAFVLPLLVTDNLEGLLKSRSRDKLRQLALAASFIAQGAGGEIGVNKLHEDLRSIMGTDYNSLMTVSRVTDSAIQVRLGAYNQPTAGNAMIPRNHFVTFVLMVPKTLVEGTCGVPQVQVAAKSVMRHSEKGTALAEGMSKAEQLDEMKKVLKKYDPPCNPTEEEINHLFVALYENDYPKFYSTLKNVTSQKTSPHPKLCTFARIIWLDGIEITQQDDYIAQIFDLPRPVSPNWPDESQPLLLLDDGKESLSVRLYGGSGMQSNRVNARLNLKLKEDQSLPVMANAVSVEAEGRDLLLLFPSLKDWKIADMELKGNQLQGSTVEIFPSTNDRWHKPQEKVSKTYKVISYLIKEKPEPPVNFTVRTPLDSIVADGKANGKLKLFIESKKDKNKEPLVDTLEITLANAQLEKVVPGNQVKIEQGKIMAKADTTLTLTLSNLIDGNKLTIKAVGKKNGKPSGSAHADLVLTIRKGTK